MEGGLGVWLIASFVLAGTFGWWHEEYLFNKKYRCRICGQSKQPSDTWCFSCSGFAWSPDDPPGQYSNKWSGRFGTHMTKEKIDV